MHIPEAVSFADLNIDTRVIEDRLFIDCEQFTAHIAAAAYSMNLYLRNNNINDPILWAGAETMRNLAVVMWDSHDLTVAGDEKMFSQGLDNILASD